jgi:hypothetical protein
MSSEVAPIEAAAESPPVVVPDPVVTTTFTLFPRTPAYLEANKTPVSAGADAERPALAPKFTELVIIKVPVAIPVVPPFVTVEFLAADPSTRTTCILFPYDRKFAAVKKST